ncbi:hypothetical protein N656DRAFT_770513 [Canariomyces notabilis]|uniref:B30.2/SPRY domain-containing protein n=1 Tax=Canariomyces notabilis TaxID=2074819 RepID=A0AAN6QPJ2_9PEZI|nr:hypothetical protein N656DRAFT_770513 [Canariomyces arenarius]
MHGYAATVRALLAANPKPNVNLLDYQEHTALALAYEQWAVTRQKSSYEETVSLLIDADPSGAAADANLVAVCAANGSTKLLKQLAHLDGQTLLHTSGRRVCVSADKPLPAGLERYYFEVTLTEIPEGAARRAAQANTRADKPEFSEIAVGFCTLGGAAIAFPGWFPFQDNLSGAESWAYHADTGNCYESCTEVEEEIFDELRYGVGDTVGAGVDLDKGEIWFTRNGVVLEKRFKSVTGRLFPVVGLHDPVMVETNFGGHWGS